ncbi:alpha/beta hydrolase family protein [Luteimonas mephitis]|uniref:alpha/beta hydrolase family protein n=1 Tax=Luteimonas mephitis TaxID=83615 RepID=UPI003A949C18
MKSMLRTCHFLLPVLLASTSVFAAEDVRCHVGTYQLEDGGGIVAIGAVSEASQLRWRRIDGRTGLLRRDGDGAWTSTLGWTDRADGVAVGFGRCGEQRISFESHAGKRLTFDVTDTTFEGNGVTLRGRLVLPEGDGRVPVVVEVHGSESYSAVDLNYMQQLFPAQGVGVFVYDKRGTGQSTGSYTQDFQLLADDAKAALLEARRLAGERAGRIGFHGASQGGWVAPLAASTAPAAQFVLVAYGMATDPLAEDRDQVMLDLRKAGYGDDVLARAREVTEATASVVASRGARGWEQLDVVRAKYAGEPWWPAMQGEFTGMVAHHTRAEVEAIAPTVEVGTSWDYDPMPVLRALAIPQLWIIAGADSEAPPEETMRRLQALAAEGRPITTQVFPGTDHGIVAFETGADGERMETGYADGYFRMMADWLRDGRLAPGAYGNAQLLAAPSAPAAPASP